MPTGAPFWCRIARAVPILVALAIHVAADTPDCVPLNLQEPGTWQSPAAVPGSGCARAPMGAGEARGLYGFSGEFCDTAVDMRIRGRGFDFVWMRTYRSRSGRDTAQGKGWDFSYNIHISDHCRPSILLHDGNGRSDLYQLQPGTLTWAADQFFRVLSEEVPPGYRLGFGDKSAWRFYPFDGSPAEGRIREIVDRNNNRMRFEYDAQGRLTEIHDTISEAVPPRIITIAYNGDGYIESVTDFTGRRVQYSYYQNGDAGGSAGDLKSVTSPAVTGTPNGNDFPNGKTTVYSYSTGFADPRLNHNLLTINDPKGQLFLQNTYAPTTDAGDLLFDRLIRQHLGNPQAPEDAIGIFYAAQTPAPGNNSAVVKTTVTDRNGNVRDYFYDARNRLVMQHEHTRGLHPGIEPPLYDTRWSYNADSLPNSVSYPNGNRLEQVYELDVNPAAERIARGNLRESRRIAGPLDGDQAVISETFEYLSDFGCCGGNFVTRHVDARNDATVYEYDGNGNRLHTQHRLPGIVEDFEYNGFGQLTAHILPANGSGHRRRDEFTYHPAGNQAGYMASEVVDATGLQLTTRYNYDSRGNLVEKIDPNLDDPTAENPGDAPAHTTYFVYNALDEVVRQTSRRVSAALPVRYSTDTWYDANDNVVRVDVDNFAAGAVSADPANPVLTTITEYEILNRPRRTFSERGTANLPPGVTTPAGIPDISQFIINRFEYDANRNLIRQFSGEAENGNQPGNLVETRYDERDLPFQVIHAPADPQHSTAQTDYDGNRNPVRTRSGIEAGPAGWRETSAVYDGHNRLTRSTDAMGNVTIYQYDANGNRVHQLIKGELIDVPGSTANVLLSETTFHYDFMDWLDFTHVAHFNPVTLAPIGDGLATTETRYAPNGQVTQVIDDGGHITRTLYDTANRRAAVEDALLNRTEFVYDANSNLVRTTESELSDLSNLPQVFVTRFFYDGLDRQVRMVDNINSIMRFEYDSRGNQTRLTDAQQNESRTDYDSADRPVRSVNDMDGDGADATNFNDLDIVNDTSWDDAGRLRSRTDDGQNATAEEFDVLDRPKRVDYADCADQTRAFDVHGNVRRECQPTATRIEYDYDKLNRVTDKRIFVYDPLDPQACTPVDNMPQNVSADTTFEHFQYDGLSRMVRAENDLSVVTRTYDSLSNVIEENLNGYVTTAVYDGESRRASCVYPSGRIVTWSYDALDRIKTVSDNLLGLIATYYYIGPSRVERRDLNANGTRCEYTYDGIPATQPPNDFGVKQIVRTRHVAGPIGAPIVIDEREYAWDAVGNKKMRRDVTPGPPLSQYEHTYRYDRAYRLERTTIRNGFRSIVRDTDYVLDGVGNRESVGLAPDAVSPIDAGDYTMQPLCEPADQEMNQYTETSFDGRVYDYNGNLVGMQPAAIAGLGDMNCDGRVSVSDIAGFVLALVNPAAFETSSGGCDMQHGDINNDTQVSIADIGPFVALLTGGADGAVNLGGRVPAQIRYDYANRMVSYTAAGQRHLYRYDALGRRIEKIVDADGAAGGPFATRYVLDGWQEIEERGGGAGPGALLATYAFGRYIDEALTIRRDPDGIGPAPFFDVFYHADDLYNVMALTGSTGAVLEGYQYDDYGRPLNPLTLAPMPVGGDPSGFGNPLLFNGRRYEPETGLYYYRTRYLDPQVGRFTTRDDIGIWGDDGQKGNATAYALSNPASYLDPIGTHYIAKDGAEKYQKLSCRDLLAELNTTLKNERESVQRSGLKYLASPESKRLWDHIEKIRQTLKNKKCYADQVQKLKKERDQILRSLDTLHGSDFDKRRKAITRVFSIGSEIWSLGETDTLPESDWTALGNSMKKELEYRRAIAAHPTINRGRTEAEERDFQDSRRAARGRQAAKWTSENVWVIWFGPQGGSIQNPYDGAKYPTGYGWDLIPSKGRLPAPTGLGNRVAPLYWEPWNENFTPAPARRLR